MKNSADLSIVTTYGEIDQGMTDLGWRMRNDVSRFHVVSFHFNYLLNFILSNPLFFKLLKLVKKSAS